MQLARLRIELPLQRTRVHIQLARQFEDREVVLLSDLDCVAQNLSLQNGESVQPCHTLRERTENFLSAERRTTTARLRRVRIDEVETLLHQALLIIEHHPMQVDERLRIHEHAYALELIHAVAFARLRIEPNVVAQPRASAALHAQP